MTRTNPGSWMPHGPLTLLLLHALLTGLGDASAQTSSGRPARGATLPQARSLPRVETELQSPRPLPGNTAVELKTQVGLPTREELFRPESETVSRLRAGEKVIPPTQGAVPLECNQRCLPGAAASLVPEVVCYRPLYFEDRNTERYGWRIPVVQPLVSAGKFYADTLLLPVKMVVEPPWKWECDPGFPKPGDPVPYRVCPYRLGSHVNSPQESGVCTRGTPSGE